VHFQNLEASLALPYTDLRRARTEKSAGTDSNVMSECQPLLARIVACTSRARAIPLLLISL
jgi:hypothetical protein